jgi:hypothetical protein
MEAVLERENLKTALAQVKRNKGAAGISNSPALSLSLPNAYFRSLGLTSIAESRHA